MRVRDLGPLRVVAGAEELPISGAKQEALLSMLVMRANERVPLAELVAAAWGYEADVSSSTIENHVWRLRRLLEPGRGPAGASVLISDRGGYRLILAEDESDSARFERLADRASALLEAGDPAGAREGYDAAMRLWRGTPYVPIAHLDATAAAVGRLDELRAHVLERRIDALLGSGQHERALADLQPLIAEFPYRERLWAQRMSGLRDTGRNEEALATYRRVRELLAEELGLEPGPELRRLQSSILERSAELPAAARAVPAPLVRLPRRRQPLIGRADEVAGIVRGLEEHPLVTVTGVGGCGKTRLALEVAGLVSPSYPDGVWFVDLTTVTEPVVVAEIIATTLGITAVETSVDADAATRAVASFVEGRRMLLVLDNCEHVIDGVAAVVEAILEERGSDAALLATSREPLEVDGESVWALAPLSVEGALPSSEPPAVELFLARAGLADAARPPSADERETIHRICSAVDGLPLAIELAAARVGAFTLAEIAEQVTADPSGLSRVGGGRRQDHRSTLWSTIEWSHRLLTPPEQIVHRRLSALPGPFTLPAATAVSQGSELAVADVPAALASLVHRSLLVAIPPARQGRPTLFRQLDTVRAHAARRLADAGETAAVLRRRDAWVRQLLGRRPRLGDADGAAWYDTLDEVYPVIRAALASAAHDGEPDWTLIRHAGGLLYYWYYRERLLEGRSSLEAIADAVAPLDRADEDRPEATILRAALTGLSLLTGRVEQARRQADAVLARVASVPDDDLVDLGEALASAGNSAWARNEYGISAALGEALDAVARRAGDPALRLLADQVDCVSHLPDRDPAETAALAEGVYERARGSRNLLALWTACAARMIVSALTGDPDTGIVWVDRLIPAHARFGSGGGGAFLEALANFASLAGDPELAVTMYAAASSEIRRVGMVWPIQLNTLELLDRARANVDDALYVRLWSEGESLTYERVARDRGLVP